MMKAIAVPVVCAVLLAGCAERKLSPLTVKPEDLKDIGQLYGKSELYVVYKKDEKGNPTEIIKTTDKQADAVGFFSGNANAIKSYDCIRITAATVNGHNVSVCDQGRWFDYGTRDQSILTTRKAKDAASAAWGGAVGTALSPLTLAIDVLSFDPKLSSTRKSLTRAVSDPVQDFEVLKQVKLAVDALATKKWEYHKDEAGKSIAGAKFFMTYYAPGTVSTAERDAIVRANIEREGAKSPNFLYAAMSALPLSPENRARGLSILRGANSFDGYARAFDLSSDIDDAKRAEALATTSGDKRKTEYMALKLIERKVGNINRLFALRATQPTTSAVTAVRGNGFIFVDTVSSGRGNFSSELEVSADKSIGVFAYGVYDVTVKATVSLRQHMYRQSFWLGNVDETKTNTVSAEEVVRISGPDYRAVKRVGVNDVILNFKERGSAGGTTEVTLIGDPQVTFEVTNVKLVD